MALNKILVNGRLPRFEGNYKAGEGEGKRSFLSWAVSVKRDFKPEGAQYYPEDLLNIKAFGPKADFINKFFAQGDGIVISGRLQRDDDYEKDGQTVKGQMYILVEDAYFPEGKSGDAGLSNAGTTAKAAPAGRPGAPGKPPVGGGAPGKPPVARRPGIPAAGRPF